MSSKSDTDQRPQPTVQYGALPPDPLSENRNSGIAPAYLGPQQNIVQELRNELYGTGKQDRLYKKTMAENDKCMSVVVSKVLFWLFLLSLLGLMGIAFFITDQVLPDNPWIKWAGLVNLLFVAVGMIVVTAYFAVQNRQCYKQAKQKVRSKEKTP